MIRHWSRTAVLCAVTFACSAQEIRVIIQADDLGAGHGINVAAIEAYKNGIVRTANVLMPAGWAPEAARLLNENPGLEAGVHLTLTSEWTTVKWRPLTAARSLMDENGYLFRAVRSRGASATAASVADGKPSSDEIEQELRAQIVMAKRMIPRLAYLHPHMGFDSLSADVPAIVQKLAREFGLIWAERDIPRQTLTRVWERADSGDVRGIKLAEKLEAIGPGTWFMLEHPARDTPEMQAFGGDVARDRSAVLQAWTHPKVLGVVRKRNIRLIGHREAMQAK
jgi:predicted glycoside hydrolase/deacetylase ChbG (UPF0249 family)